MTYHDVEIVQRNNSSLQFTQPVRNVYVEIRTRYSKSMIKQILISFTCWKIKKMILQLFIVLYVLCNIAFQNKLDLATLKNEV